MSLPLGYHWRNLFVRKSATLLTLGVVVAVVAVFSWMAGFYSALNDSLSLASDPRKLIVLKPGATAESNSAIAKADRDKLTQLTEIAVDPATGDALISPEMLVQVSLPRIRDNGATFANVAVRGVTEMALKVHPNVKLDGAMFSTSAPQVIVGRALMKQFAGLAIGDMVPLGSGGNRAYEVVGTFSAGGATMQSEIWGYLPSLKDSYRREMDSSLSVRLTDGADTGAIIRKIGDAPFELAAQTETEYWDAQVAMVRVYLFILAFIIGIMAIAAVFSIANTMYAMVAGRTRELAMLRTIGFSGRQMLFGIVIESVMLTLPAALLGVGACWTWLRLVGNTKDMFGTTTFTTMAFEIHLSPIVALIAVGLVTGVALVGALAPAVRAARIDVLDALREE
jgi:ABC-type lipoprotein release transport system permease subunit